MNGRDDMIYEEACALWRALYNEAPPADADGGMLLEAISRGGPVMDYDRLHSVHLRAANITRPRA